MRNLLRPSWLKITLIILIFAPSIFGLAGGHMPKVYWHYWDRTGLIVLAPLAIVDSFVGFPLWFLYVSCLNLTGVDANSWRLILPFLIILTIIYYYILFSLLFWVINWIIKKRRTN